MTVGPTLGIGAAPTGTACALWLPRAVLRAAPTATQLVSGVAGGLTASPHQTQVLQHAPAQAAGVGGAILQMARRITEAVCLSVAPAAYVRAASGPADGSCPRAGHAPASCVRAGLLALALLLSLLRRAATPPRPSADRSRRPGRNGAAVLLSLSKATTWPTRSERPARTTGRWAG
ncbi:hypothetical protein [Streptomyces silvensis]|uniref:hypothetical protein n=1 Tax=Streptomyces silvensis TaxID=1765722 RepID=UPI0007C66509|nr:hypothetical protein [Streptomyces silvensis]